MTKCMCTEETQGRNFSMSGFNKLKKGGEGGVNKALGQGTVQRRAWRGEGRSCYRGEGELRHKGQWKRGVSSKSQ